MPAMQLHWDLFCRVVDNYGDIGVCWRLARQLAREHGKAVRLWVDDLASLVPICPDCDANLPTQHVQGVEIRRWTENFTVDRVGAVVIEAFACELPSPYIAAMAATTPKPRWINLEYLTAEPWAESCHGLASPHPSLPLVKHFFFPGFSPATGGLLRETGLPLPAPHNEPDPLEISLFCYDTAPVASLLAALAATRQPSVCHVPPGKPLTAVTTVLGGAGPWQLGAARIAPIAFLPLDDYDALLRRCAINFVRGEDSFIRAQWAGRPFVWQIYPQDDAAHHVKLEAFLDRYCAAMDGELATTMRGLFTAWNSGHDIAALWPTFVARHQEIARHNAQWARHLAGQTDLTTALVNFAAAKV
ncbi:MAG: elongation factor P maturation arginine rhamnosyltransferase EarP [Betaproteobacteria bacterium HGW-Betaproteobacteria-12]|nr:MAG: elongation factor P maturation arginine rhamnosyltransferase EarP [Betaproteobacteria bacterium HGW-Betaproteobacteria-12]